jgi:hypothetical protein
MVLSSFEQRGRLAISATWTNKSFGDAHPRTQLRVSVDAAARMPETSQRVCAETRARPSGNYSQRGVEPCTSGKGDIAGPQGLG